MSTQFVLRIRSRRAGSFLLNASYQSETFFLSARAFAAWASGPIIITPRKKADIGASWYSFPVSAFEAVHCARVHDVLHRRRVNRVRDLTGFRRGGALRLGRRGEQLLLPD